MERLPLKTRRRRLTVLDTMVVVALASLPLGAMVEAARAKSWGPEAAVLVLIVPLLLLGLWRLSGISLRGASRWLALPLWGLGFFLGLALLTGTVALAFLSPVAAALLTLDLIALVLYLVSWE
jgi:hypothetical protein